MNRRHNPNEDEFADQISKHLAGNPEGASILFNLLMRSGAMIALPGDLVARFLVNTEEPIFVGVEEDSELAERGVTVRELVIRVVVNTGFCPWLWLALGEYLQWSGPKDLFLRLGRQAWSGCGQLWSVGVDAVMGGMI